MLDVLHGLRDRAKAATVAGDFATADRIAQTMREFFDPRERA